MMAAKRNKLVSDGTPTGTKLFDPKGNEIPIGSASRITWEIKPGHLGVVTVTYPLTEAEVQGDMAGSPLDPNDAPEAA